MGARGSVRSWRRNLGIALRCSVAELPGNLLKFRSSGDRCYRSQMTPCNGGRTNAEPESRHVDQRAHTLSCPEVQLFLSPMIENNGVGGKTEGLLDTPIVRQRRHWRRLSSSGSVCADRCTLTGAPLRTSSGAPCTVRRMPSRIGPAADCSIAGDSPSPGSIVFSGSPDSGESLRSAPKAASE